MVDTSNIPPHLLPPDPNTEEGRKKIEDLRKHNEGIGKLVTIFPVIEIQLFTTLGSLWNVPAPIAKAIYGDLRIDAAISAARRLLDARQQVFGANPFEKEITKWFDYIFVQLAIINGVRNHIIHHGVLGTTDFANPIASNRLRARAESHVKEFPVSADEVDAMNHDLSGIIGMLAVITLTVIGPPAQRTAGFAMLERTAREQPWRYKSPLQGGKKGKTPDKAPAQPRPPGPSGA